MLHFRPDLRFRTVPSSLLLTQRPMAMGFRLHGALGLGRVLTNDVALSTVGGIAPHPCPLAMQQLRSHLTVMHIRRRGCDRMNQLRLAVHVNMGLHAEIPLGALLCLIHLGIPLLGPILRRTPGTDDGGIHDGAAADLQPLLRQILPKSWQRVVRRSGAFPADARTCRSPSRQTQARGSDHCPPTIAWPASRTVPLRPPNPAG